MRLEVGSTDPQIEGAMESGAPRWPRTQHPGSWDTGRSDRQR